METKISHIQKMRAQYAYNRKQVLWLTGMTDYELSCFIYDMGIDWLHHYTGCDKELLNDLVRQPIIWKWWTNEWNLLDDTEILGMLYRRPANERMAQYRAMHNVVFIKHVPAYTLLEESYAKVINEFNDQLKQEEI